MKRETLFKAKHYRSNIWYFGFYWFNEFTKEHFLKCLTEGGTQYEDIKVHPETVCQFTGLLDKNGNKIFEGDKLSDKVFVYVVEWNKQNTAFCLKPIEKIETKDLDIIDYILYQNLGNGYLNRRDLEIIGNIHD